MPKVNVSLSKFTLNKGEFTKTLDLAIQREMRLAAREFLKAAIRVIPVRTGFVRGSLNNLASAVRVSETAGEGPRAERFLKLTSKVKRGTFARVVRNEYYHFGSRRVLKTPQSGRAFSTKPENIFVYGKGRYTFNFQVSIRYFNLNDLTASIPGAPWNSFALGREAFQNYMRTTGMTKLPKVKDFIVKTKVGRST